MAGLRPEEYVLCNNIEWIEKADCWKGLKGIGMVKSTIYHTKSKKETTETRYYITSLTTLTGFADTVRKHWCIENQLHWNLDVIFRKNACLAKKRQLPEESKHHQKDCDEAFECSQVRA